MLFHPIQKEQAHKAHERAAHIPKDTFIVSSCIKISIFLARVYLQTIKISSHHLFHRDPGAGRSGACGGLSCGGAAPLHGSFFPAARGHRAARPARTVRCGAVFACQDRTTPGVLPPVSADALDAAWGKPRMGARWGARKPRLTLWPAPATGSFGRSTNRSLPPPARQPQGAVPLSRISPAPDLPARPGLQRHPPPPDRAGSARRRVMMLRRRRPLDMPKPSKFLIIFSFSPQIPKGTAPRTCDAANLKLARAARKTVGWSTARAACAAGRRVGQSGTRGGDPDLFSGRPMRSVEVAQTPGKGQQPAPQQDPDNLGVNGQIPNPDRQSQNDHQPRHGKTGSPRRPPPTGRRRCRTQRPGIGARDPRQPHRPFDLARLVKPETADPPART